MIVAVDMTLEVIRREELECRYCTENKSKSAETKREQIWGSKDSATTFARCQCLTCWPDLEMRSRRMAVYWDCFPMNVGIQLHGKDYIKVHPYVYLC